MGHWKIFEDQFPLIMHALKNAKQAERLGHSYLLISSNARYRIEFPRILAALAACKTPNADGSPCECCRSCTEILGGIYPDMFILAPTSKSRVIPVGESDDEPDTLRSFESVFHLSSNSPDGWKIGVIQDADTMNANAQNAFLKTLEEPPKNTVFILTTGRAASLLPTIRSRCQPLALIDNHCVYEFTSFEQLPEILMKMQFRAVNDLVAAEDAVCALITLLDSLEEIAKKTVEGKWKERLAQAANLESSGLKLLEKRISGEASCEYLRLREQFTSILHTWFAQIALLSAGTAENLLPNPEVIRPYLESDPRPKIKERDAFRMLNDTNELLNTLKTNVNDELAIRSFVLNICIRK